MKALRHQDKVAEEPSHRPAERIPRKFDPAAGSEVALLQQYVEAEFAQPEPARRLPLAISFTLIAAISAALWMGIATGVRLLAG